MGEKQSVQFVSHMICLLTVLNLFKLKLLREKNTTESQQIKYLLVPLNLIQKIYIISLSAS